MAGVRAEVGEIDLLEFWQEGRGGEVDGAIEDAVELEFADTWESGEGRARRRRPISDRGRRSTLMRLSVFTCGS